MALQFDHPFALLLLLLIPPFLWLARGKPRASGPRQRATAFVLRGLLFTALALAIASPRLGRPDDRLSIVFAVDGSASIQPPQQARFQEWVRQAQALARSDDFVSVVDFGRWASPRESGGLAGPLVDATNLADALGLSASLLPPEGQRRIVLLTDGQQNVGRAQSEAAKLAEQGITVSFASPEQPVLLPDVLVQGLEAPSYVREGETLQVDALIESTHATAATLRLLLDGREILSQTAELRAGSQRVPLVARPNGLGFHVIRLEVGAEQDSTAENNAYEAYTVVKESGRVLVLESRDGEAAQLDAVLRETGLQTEVRPTSVVPPNAAPLQVYDSIVLANVPSTALTLDQQTTLISYVQDYGRGLLVVGGNTSYSFGGYATTPLGELLPVDATPPARRERGSLALVLVVDKSGSMDLARSDVSKIAMAREAALLATETLEMNDQVGVLAFDSRFDWVVPMTRLQSPADVNMVKSRIAAIRADGGTAIYPALEAAYRQVVASDANLKHIVLLTDGQDTAGEYADLLNRMKPFNITLTTIGVGSDTDTALLTKIATLGEGRHYFTQRPAEVPRIITRETTIVSRNALVEGLIHPRLTEPSPLLADLHGQSPPPLNGYVATSPRPRAHTILTSDRGDPLLASWQFGLGRVVAWTADGQSQWSGPWLDSQAARRVWAQAVRWSMPQPIDPAFQLSAEIDHDEVRLRVQALERDGRFADRRDVVATVTTPGGQALRVPLRQVGPGAYEVAAQPPGTGTYSIVAEELRNGAVIRSADGGFVVPPSPELRTVGPDRQLLEQVAQVTGGRELGSPVDAFVRDQGSHATRWMPLWPWLLVLALVLLPLDVAARRLSLARRR